MSSERMKVRRSEHLPAIFQSAQVRNDPLRAILDIAEKIFADLQTGLDGVERFFDPLVCPATKERDFLNWLAGWVALRLDEDWDERKKRNIVKEAANLYRLRGTCKGLKYIIELFFDVVADIEEWRWSGMVVGCCSIIGIDTFIGARPTGDHYFMVTCLCTPGKGRSKKELERKIRHLIDLEKPAHTTYYLNVV
jgi:phage tail-like protein